MIWNDEAATFAEHWAGLADPARDAVAEALDIKAGTTVLDVGCGSGDFCAQAIDRGAVVSGIDAAPAMVAFARRLAPRADIRTGGMDALPWDDGRSTRSPASTASSSRTTLSGRCTSGCGSCARTASSPSAPGPSRGSASWKRSSPRCASMAPAPPPRAAFGRPGNLGRLMRAAGLEPEPERDVSVPFEVHDQARLELALLFDARAYDVPEADARATIVAAAAPFRRRDGSYRFENVFRYVISRPSPSRTPAGT